MTLPKRNVLTDALLRAYFYRAVPSLFEDGQSLGVEQEPYVLWDSTKSVPVDVSGRYNHAIQIVGLDGTDSLKVQGSLDGVNYQDIGTPDLTALIADGIHQFSGVYRNLRAVRNSGTGVTTKLLLLSQVG